MTQAPLRRLVVICFAALALLGLAWELWLAPLRPGAWLLSLKVLPLLLALPGQGKGVGDGRVALRTQRCSAKTDNE
jgi:uncharacterized membrane protein